MTMLRKIIYATLAAACAALFVWAVWPKPVVVETAAIGRATIEVHVEEEGKSRIREIFTVSAPIQGSLMRVGLHPGDPVEAGKTVIASIRPAAPALLDARARRVAEAVEDAAAAAVELASAQLKQQEAQYEFMVSEAARSEVLHKRGTISDRTYEKTRLDLLAAAATADSARANLLVRQRELESARAALMQGDAAEDPAQCCVEITAPLSGRILRVLTESEQIVAPGAPLMEIGDPADLEVEVEMLSRDAVRVAKGTRAVIDAWGGPPLAATVQRVDPSAVTKVSALGIEEQRVTVILTLDGNPADRVALGDGFRVIARIALWRGEDLVAVPVGALFRDGSDWAVYAVRDGRAQVQPVRLGERNNAFAEVISGLAPGDIVILHPSDTVSEGVRVMPVADAP
jgi:HlyD family secretion protein